MLVELSVQAATQDWFMQSIQPYMATMAWLEFKERFLRYFCPPLIRDNYRLQLLHIVRKDKSVEDYTQEFFRLSYHTKDMMRDWMRVVELYVIGLGPAYIGIRIKW